MEQAEFDRLLRLADERIAKCEPRKAEYWRGYRRGIKFHFQGKMPESLPDHYSLLHSATHTSGDQYVDAYARGYRDGCTGSNPEGSA